MKDNYSEYVMVSDAYHQWRFADLYTIALGELQSSIERRRLSVSIAIEQNNLARLSQYDQDCIANPDAAGKMGAEQQAGHYENMLAIYYRLPVSMRHGRLFMYFRLVASAQLLQKEPEEYNAAASDFQRLFPGDPCQYLVRYHAAIATKDFQGLYDIVDRLQVYTGGDPYLLWIKGYSKFLQGGDQNCAESGQLFRQAIHDEPTFSKPYFGLIDISLRDKDYAQTASLLETVETKLRVRLRDLSQVPAYAGFVKSDAYRKWRDHHN